MRLLGVDAAFSERSAAPGTEATLVVRTDASALTVQMLRSGPETVPTYANNVINGIAVGAPVQVDWRRTATPPARVHPPSSARLAERRLRRAAHGRRRAPRLRAARRAADGAAGTGRGRDADEHVGSLQLLRRGRRRLGRHLVRALEDDARRPHAPAPEPRRPLPLPQLRPRLPALAGADRQARRHLRATRTSSSFADADRLRAAYDLIVFPGHTEYVTGRRYDLIQGYRDLGGNLLFLSANNFFRKVDRATTSIRR